MAGAIMNKVWDLFGMDTERDAEEVEEKTYDNNDYDTKHRSMLNRKMTYMG